MDEILYLLHDQDHGCLRMTILRPCRPAAVSTKQSQLTSSHMARTKETTPSSIFLIFAICASSLFLLLPSTSLPSSGQVFWPFDGLSSQHPPEVALPASLQDIGKLWAWSGCEAHLEKSRASVASMFWLSSSRDGLLPLQQTRSDISIHV